MALFEPNGGRSNKIHCTVCDVTGYDVDGPRSWKNAHIRGHLPCKKCGRQLTITIDGKRRQHACCPRQETA